MILASDRSRRTTTFLCNGDFVQHPRGPLPKLQNAVGKSGGLGMVVGNQQRRGGTCPPCVQYQLSASRGHRRVERDERFV